jgi:eukaryotic-like serine/threonine-protein kinase
VAAGCPGRSEKCQGAVVRFVSSMKPEPGGTLGPYRIGPLLARGGMGEVYRAEDTRLGRVVAIKFLSAELADESVRRRFQQEAKMASALNHPHILTVHEADEIGGRQYLVTEFIDGGTLRDWAGGATRSWRHVVELLIGVADALVAAHRAGILHRDIKPENILVTSSGYAKLADFGLAKLDQRFASDAMTGTVAAHTRPGIVVGTVAYMSPEQLEGQPLDARSDVFSFAVVLYELLAGRRPFPGASDFEVLQAIVHRPADPLPASVPLPLRLAVEKALEKDPADRFQSMSDMAVDLRRLLRHADSPPAAAQIAAGPIGKWKWPAMAVAVALGLTVGTTIFLKRAWTPGELARLEYTQLTNFADSVVAPSLSPDGRMLAFIRGQNTFVGAGEVYVKILPDGEPVQLTRDGFAKMGPTVFSPDGSRIGYTVDVHNSWSVPVLGGEPSRLLANAGGLTWTAGPGPRHVLFSKLVGTGIHMGLFTSRESRSEERKVYLPTDVNGMAHRSALSPDQKWVLTVEMDLGGWLPCRLVPFDGRSQGTAVGPAPAQCTDAAWSPDGLWMYFSANTGSGFHIWRQRFANGSPEQVTSTATEEQGIAFDPNGRSFVTSIGESQSTIWLHDDRGDRQITSQGYAFMPALSDDGTLVYYLQRSQASRRFVSGELWVANVATGRRERLLPDFLMEHYSMARDGRRVVFVSIDSAGRSEVWLATLDNSSPPRRLMLFDAVVRALFDPAGGLLFVGGERGSPFLYHIREDGSGLRKVLPQPITFLYAVSPEGKAIAVWEGDSVIVYSSDGSRRTLVCARCATAGEENRGVTPPLVSWSPDGGFVYLHAAYTRQTYAISVGPGEHMPRLPSSGLSSIAAAAQLPRSRLIPAERAFAGANPSVFVFPRVTTHRNIYRIAVP